MPTRTILFGAAGTLLLGVVWGITAAILNIGPAGAFLGGMVAGCVGMLGGLRVGGANL